MQEPRVGEELDDPAEQAPGQQGRDHVREPRPVAPERDSHREGGDPHHDRIGIDVPEELPEVGQDLVKAQAARHLHAEEVLELARRDQHRGPGGEPDDDRVRDEVDEGAEPREAHHELNGANHEREGERVLHVGRAARHR